MVTWQETEITGARIIYLFGRWRIPLEVLPGKREMHYTNQEVLAFFQLNIPKRNH